MDKKDLVVYGTLLGLAGVGYYVYAKQKESTGVISPEKYVYFVYDIPQYYAIETDLYGPENYFFISEGPGTVAVEVPPGTYSISVKLYNPTTYSFIYQLENLTTTPSLVTTGSVVYVSAQANTQMTIYLQLTYQNWGFHTPNSNNVIITINYNYIFYDIFGKAVYTSPTISVPLTLSYNGCYIIFPTNMGIIGTISVPPGITSVAIDLSYNTTEQIANCYNVLFYSSSLIYLNPSNVIVYATNQTSTINIELTV